MRRLLLSLSILFSFLCHAGVNIRSGNFFINYTDIAFPGSKTELNRTYNSLTTTVGLFGYGWGTYIETRLFALPDGHLSVRWWGSGSEDVFMPESLNQKGLYHMIKEIVAYEINTGKLDNNPVDILKRKSTLASEADTRISKYIDLVKKKIVTPWVQPPHTKKTWKRNINQVIKWDGNKYSLQSWNDHYSFIATGLLSEIIEPETQLKLVYKNNLLSEILIDNKFRCTINSDSSGKLTRLVFIGNNGIKEAIFKYDNNDNLIYSKDAGNNEYWYQYDKIHNLTRINYTDTTFMEVTYDPVTNRTTRVKERNGATKTYQYPFFYTPDGKINFLHFATRIKSYDSTGENIFNEYYEYESRLKADGGDYLYRRLVQTDTLYDEAIYPPYVGNAVFRKKNNSEAWAAYDGKNRCVYLKLKDSVYLSSYSLADKPDKFWEIDSLRKDTVLYRYNYDKNGELNQTIKSGTLYKINGSRQKGQIEVTKKNIGLLIKFKNGEPYSIENKELGYLQLKEKEYEQVAQSDSPAAQLMSNAGNKSIAEEKRKEINSAEEEATRRNADNYTSQAQKGENKHKASLLRLYVEYKEVMEAKSIQHEWIWERL